MRSFLGDHSDFYEKLKFSSVINKDTGNLKNDAGKYPI